MGTVLAKPALPRDLEKQFVCLRRSGSLVAGIRREHGLRLCPLPLPWASGGPFRPIDGCFVAARRSNDPLIHPPDGDRLANLAGGAGDRIHRLCHAVLYLEYAGGIPVGAKGARRVSLPRWRNPVDYILEGNAAISVAIDRCGHPDRLLDWLF